MNIETRKFETRREQSGISAEEWDAAFMQFHTGFHTSGSDTINPDLSESASPE